MRRDQDPSYSKARRMPLPFGDVIFNKMLVNKDGFVANNVADKEGRDNYFPGTGGASESILLLTKGVADAYNATQNEGWKDYLLHILKGLGALYMNHTSDVGHWLFSVKNAFVGEKPHYARIFPFTAGKATIPEYLGGGITKSIFHVRSNTSSYLWVNPYAALTSGSFYPILSHTKNSNNTTDVQLVDTSFNGTAYIMYTTLEGDTIPKSGFFEAWPYWRILEPGEVNVAMDSIVWSLQTYTAVNKALGGFQAQIDNISSKVLSHYNVNDGRAWITKRTVYPLQVSGSFIFSEIPTGDPGKLQLAAAPDGAIEFFNTAVPAASGFQSEMQFGRAVTDSILPLDYIHIDITSTRAITVQFIIDTANTYGAATRFYYTHLLSVGSNILNVARTSFQNSDGPNVSLSVGAPVYDIAWRVLNTHLTTVSPFKLTIKEFRPKPDIPLAYMPGISPFTANYVNGENVGWRGPVYSGYQYPTVWDYVPGYSSNSQKVLNYLIAAQAAYTATHPGITGPFAPVYILQRYDSVQYAPAGTFTWNGPDPNTGWEGYQVRPLADTAEFLFRHPGDPKALQICTAFMTYLNTAFDPVLGFPTEYSSGAAPAHTYFSAHATFMILRAAIYMSLANHDTGPSLAIITKARNIIRTRYKDGIWGQGNEDWFSFWNGEALTTLSLIKEYEIPVFTEKELDNYFTANLAYLNLHTEFQ